MAIEIKMIEGEACPVITCDITGQVITDATMANAYWSEGEGPMKGKVFFALKAHDQHHKKMPNESWYPLPLFLKWLNVNSGYTESIGAASAKDSQCDGCLHSGDV